MKLRHLCLALAALSAIPTQASTAPAGVDCTAVSKNTESDPRCTAKAKDKSTAPDAAAAALDPAKLLSSTPPAAGVAKPGPMTRRQVIAEIERARRNGEMDYARSELGPYAPPASK